ncbi:MAG: mechanosensitive ion channel [Saprospiraceae bacterium]|nr:mechanosensitive ion channel [Saprospiraceae bacterium]
MSQLLQDLSILIGFPLAGFSLTWLLFLLFRRYGRRRDLLTLRSMHANLRWPACFLVATLAFMAVLPLSGLEAAWLARTQLMAEISLYVFGAWAVIESTDVFGDILQAKYPIDIKDNLEERKVITQLQYIKQLVTVVVVFLALSFILLQFDSVRELGAGLLTSAGVAGVILGFAAQKSIANLLAGIQLAFTQPIRIDDVVVLEGEWGRIEEITLTYVVVRIWDQRRLVVPLNYFNEKAFQNWTRTSADILGTVFIYTDYRVPLEELRRHFFDLLEQTPLWDGKVKVVQVTDSTEKSMQVRFLMSARTSPEAWDLRCHVREAMITYLQRHHPECLPRTRVDLDTGTGKTT